jgi:hypothetical protein
LRRAKEVAVKLLFVGDGIPDLERSLGGAVEGCGIEKPHVSREVAAQIVGIPVRTAGRVPGIHVPEASKKAVVAFADLLVPPVQDFRSLNSIVT